MKVVVYSTNCPKCSVLEKRLTTLGIEHDTVLGADEILKRGFQTAPLLEVDGKIMDFKEGMEWAKTME